ncbi:hypothetical protein NLJ89_g7641 [Agrocybe chaxingu]|uniref:Major facilitator superfamily (MFS) profile domain-containing protein n=1 Tax=Agrocybe chaxingu TaxID=84603 RepID=A0A9W8MV92_9AGAR|nr:hypothetical protein NLJ89_g7641 [Agrocybe chaxingu]
MQSYLVRVSFNQTLITVLTLISHHRAYLAVSDAFINLDSRTFVRELAMTMHQQAGEERALTMKQTPLPVGQLSILLFLRFCESAFTFVIYPFLEELLASLTGDEEKVGYYAGVMEFARNLVSLATVMFWSRLSDHIGRKPILLLGTFSIAVSMVSFGFSKVFWVLVLSRCIFTTFNSNAGVIKSMIGEITDHTNSASAFALLHVPWALGYSFGAFIGGWLARPNDHFPTFFPDKFWTTYPYLLPCAVIAALSLFGCFIALFYLNETLDSGWFSKSFTLAQDDSEASRPLLESVDHHLTEIPVESEPIPFRHLLTRKVLIPSLNYTWFAALHAASNTIQPLFLAMPINIGGLALPPRYIGYILGAYGLMNSVFQSFFLSRLVRRFGVKAIFVYAVSALVPIFALPPLMNVVARERGVDEVVWTILACQLACMFFMESAYGCIYMFITASAPNKRSLGAVNGLAQTLVSVGRITLPALASSLLSLSIQKNILSGYGSYFTLMLLALGGIRLARLLPQELEELPD